MRPRPPESETVGYLVAESTAQRLDRRRFERDDPGARLRLRPGLPRGSTVGHPQRPPNAQPSAIKIQILAGQRGHLSPAHPGRVAERSAVMTSEAGEVGWLTLAEIL